VADNGASIVVVASYVRIPLVIHVMSGLSPPIQWRFTGLSKMTGCLDRYANDQIRNAGLIVEIAVMSFNQPSTAFKKTNIAPSVLVSACVRKRLVKCA
jgi:hypothetical protein